MRNTHALTDSWLPPLKLKAAGTGFTVMTDPLMGLSQLDVPEQAVFEKDRAHAGAPPAGGMGQLYTDACAPRVALVPVTLSEGDVLQSLKVQ